MYLSDYGVCVSDTAARPDSRRDVALQRLMVVSKVGDRLPARTLALTALIWLSLAVVLGALPLPGTAVSITTTVSHVLTYTILAAVTLEWLARLAAGRDFAARLTESRWSRLGLRLCVLAFLACVFVTVALPSDDGYLLARRVVVAVVVAAFAAGYSIAARERRRGLALAVSDPAAS